MLTLGGNVTTVACVKAESRRLMLEKVETAPNTTQTHTIIVNIRNSELPNGKSVRLKNREIGVFHWDNSLTLEFNGIHPSVCAVEIEKVDKIPTIFLAGDSTVTDQTKEPWTSWGQMLTRFFKPEIAVANYAASGETLRAFAGERRLEKILTQIKAGDYLFVQFAHNDMKRGTPQEIGYQKSLISFIEAAREHGAHPVLVTSMHRRRFDEEGKVVDTLQGFPEAMKKVAREQNVPLIDLHAMSRQFYEVLGPEDSARAFVDGTHHNAYGAYELAKCIIEGIKANVPELADYIIDDMKPYDPAKPDCVNKFNIPASPMASKIKPEGS
jgi:lysophospholipase L1-like esterase